MFPAIRLCLALVELNKLVEVVGSQTNVPEFWDAG
jgi:hypothetical protein